MRIAVVYVYPQVRMSVYYPLAKRFADTWKAHPPRIDHDLYVVLNGGISATIDRAPFKGIPNLHFVTHSNMGWDVGAYQKAAESVPCDLMVCLGAPVHFHKENWLERMADAFLEHGPGLYGCWAYVNPLPHVRTTAFWIQPELLNSYPYEVGNGRSSRYGFEHGVKSLTRHVLDAGFECYAVSDLGCIPSRQWNNTGADPDESLVLDQFTHYPDGSRLSLRLK